MASHRNLILKSLPTDEAALLQLQDVDFERDETLFEAGQRMDRIIFPDSCVVSLIVELPEGRSVECGAIGLEGAAGFGGSLATQVSYTLQRIQVAGSARQMSSTHLRACYKTCPQFAARLRRFHDSFFAQSLQSTACIAVHAVEERLARWILEMLDRTGDLALSVTHDVCALMVGSTRTTVTLAMRAFEKAGVIETQRGRILIKDRVSLEELACSCYRSTRDMYERSGVMPAAML